GCRFAAVDERSLQRNFHQFSMRQFAENASLFYFQIVSLIALAICRLRSTQKRHINMSANTSSLIATAVQRLEGRKTQQQIAREAGFPRSNMLSMIKKGKTRLPLERVPALAKALEIDPAVLFRVALKELWPGYHKV